MVRSPDAHPANAGGRHGRPWRAAGVVLVTALAVGGSALLTSGLNPAPAQPPQPAEVVTDDTAADPPAQAGGTTPGPGTTTPGPRPASPSSQPTLAPLSRSEPVRIRIPRIKVDAKVIPVGLNADGTVQVPSLKQARHAGWYRLGVSPGEVGNAVVVGHVDSAAIGPAVFFRLGALKPEDRIEVNRADGTVVRFRVESVRSYPKTKLPAELVYGTADTPRLQVITCGGTFDRKKRSYPNNIVVSAARIP
jgi:Sortase (surface protein transpeptidase)